MAMPAWPTVQKIKLYYESLTRFENSNSPYIYPMYGLGELPQVGRSTCCQVQFSYVIHQACCSIACASSPVRCVVLQQLGVPTGSPSSCFSRPPHHFSWHLARCRAVLRLITLKSVGTRMQAFARLSAVYGGTYMLSKPDVTVAFENGVAVGVTSEGETAKAKLVVGDPSYFSDKVQRTSRVSDQILPPISGGNTCRAVHLMP